MICRFEIPSSHQFHSINIQEIVIDRGMTHGELVCRSRIGLANIETSANITTGSIPGSCSCFYMRDLFQLLFEVVGPTDESGIKSRERWRTNNQYLVHVEPEVRLIHVLKL